MSNVTLPDFLQNVCLERDYLPNSCESRQVVSEHFNRVQVNFDMVGRFIESYHERLGVVEDGLEINDKKIDIIIGKQKEIGGVVGKISEKIDKVSGFKQQRTTMLLDYALKLFYAIVLLVSGWILYEKMDSQSETMKQIIKEVSK